MFEETERARDNGVNVTNSNGITRVETSRMIQFDRVAFTLPSNRMYEMAEVEMQPTRTKISLH